MHIHQKNVRVFTSPTQSKTESPMGLEIKRCAPVPTQNPKSTQVSEHSPNNDLVKKSINHQMISHSLQYNFSSNLCDY
jgi:hypothetical protein